MVSDGNGLFNLANSPLVDITEIRQIPPRKMAPNHCTLVLTLQIVSPQMGVSRQDSGV